MENEKQHNYKRPIDEYLPCEDYKGGEGFIKFFREDDKRYYFSFNSPSGKTYLRSQGYQNEPGRDNGIDSILRNSQLDERWFDGYDEEEKYYFYRLKAGNRQEIARSCRYVTKEEMLKDYAWIRGEESILGEGAKEVDGVWHSAASLRPKEQSKKEEPVASKRPVDDYLPCEDYANDEGFSKFYRDDRNEYYFSLCDDSRKTYLRSEGYTSEGGRDNGINSVIKNAPLDGRWVTDTAMDDKYFYYALKAGNRQEIARSCYYKDKDKMLTDLAWVRGEKSVIGKGSKMVNGVLMSALMLAPKIPTTPEPVVEPESITNVEPVAEVEKVVKEESIAEVKEVIEQKPIVEKVAPVAAAVSEKGGCSKWLWWLIPLLIILALCYFLCGSCDDKGIKTPSVSGVVETVKEGSKNVLDKVDASTKAVSGVVDGAGKLANTTAEKLEAAISSGDSFVLEGLNFIYNKDVLTPESKVILDEAITTLKKHSNIKVEIQGHTDNRGNDAYNKALSQRRANTIKKNLIKAGVASSRLTSVGYGERHPIATNSTDEGRAKNRRIEFKILKK